MFLITNGKASIVKYISLAVKHMCKDSILTAHQSKFMKNHHNKSKILKRPIKRLCSWHHSSLFTLLGLQKRLKEGRLFNFWTNFQHESLWKCYITFLCAVICTLTNPRWLSHRSTRWHLRGGNIWGSFKAWTRSQ